MHCEQLLPALANDPSQGEYGSNGTNTFNRYAARADKRGWGNTNPSRAIFQWRPERHMRMLHNNIRAPAWRQPQALPTKDATDDTTLAGRVQSAILWWSWWRRVSIFSPVNIHRVFQCFSIALLAVQIVRL